jgi:hypothetical protein
VGNRLRKTSSAWTWEVWGLLVSLSTGLPALADPIDHGSLESMLTTPDTCLMQSLRATVVDVRGRRASLLREARSQVTSAGQGGRQGVRVLATALELDPLYDSQFVRKVLAQAVETIHPRIRAPHPNFFELFASFNSRDREWLASQVVTELERAIPSPDSIRTLTELHASAVRLGVEGITESEFMALLRHWEYLKTRRRGILVETLLSHFEGVHPKLTAPKGPLAETRFSVKSPDLPVPRKQVRTRDFFLGGETPFDDADVVTLLMQSPELDDFLRGNFTLLSVPQLEAVLDSSRVHQLPANLKRALEARREQLFRFQEVQNRARASALKLEAVSRDARYGEGDAEALARAREANARDAASASEESCSFSDYLNERLGSIPPAEAPGWRARLKARVQSRTARIIERSPELSPGQRALREIEADARKMLRGVGADDPVRLATEVLSSSYDVLPRLAKRMKPHEVASTLLELTRRYPLFVGRPENMLRFVSMVRAVGRSVRLPPIYKGALKFRMMDYAIDWELAHPSHFGRSLREIEKELDTLWETD